MRSRFELGQCVITPGAAEVLAALAITPLMLLALHASADWGDASAEDRRANYQALRDGTRLLSAYVMHGQRFWVITEAVGDDGHRAATTILLPSEY
jgi:hypothetical protein